MPVDTEVFLRKEKEYKKVAITDPDKPEISDEILKKWQNIINITAEMIGIEAALIMRINPDSMEVFLKSESEDNPYKVGGSDSLGHGLYCETVIAKNKELYIKNALEDGAWKDNPDIDLNMISYYGLPLNWPDDKSFGTICILDSESIDLSQNTKNLLKEFKNVIEEDLKQLTEKEILKEKNDKIAEQKERLNWIIEGANLGTWETNLQTGKSSCNQRWAEMLGYKLEEIRPMTIESWKEFVHPDDFKKHAIAFKKHLEGEVDHYRAETRLKHKQGHWVWVLSRGEIISWTDDGKAQKMLGIDIDISKEQKYEEIIKELHKVAIEFQTLDKEEEICQKTIEEARELLDFDLSHIILAKENQFVPAAASEGMEAEVLPLNYGIAGKAFKNNKSYLTLDTDKDPNATPAKEIYKSGITVPMENHGVFQAISTETNAFDQRDLELAEILIANTNAALDRLYYQNELKYKSYHDGLTNLYNRRFFEEEMERLDVERQLPISIIMADLNGLKLINDNYGHEKGDEVLIKTAEILKKSLREEDIVARLGGDEFAILMPKTNKEQADRIIKRIKDKIDQITAKKALPISLALGTATKEKAVENIYEVLRKADNKMYQDKLSKNKKR